MIDKCGVRGDATLCVVIFCKWFPDYNRVCKQPMIMKLRTLTPDESRICSIDFEGQRLRS